MNLIFALNQFRLSKSPDDHHHELVTEDRAKISRTRRAIDLQEQELLQIAFLEERQNSA